MLLTKVLSNSVLSLGGRYRRQLWHQMYSITLVQVLINLISAPLDLALSMSGLSIFPPPGSSPGQEAINILGYFTAHDISFAVSALSFPGLGFISVDWSLTKQPVWPG